MSLIRFGSINLLVEIGCKYTARESGLDRYDAVLMRQGKTD